MKVKREEIIILGSYEYSIIKVNKNKKAFIKAIMSFVISKSC